MKVLVTGATGFIGSHVCVHLAKAGHAVVAASRDPAKFPNLSAFPGVIPVTLELSQRRNWPDLLAGLDAVVHVALGWGETGPEMLEADTAATVVLLEAARLAGVSRFVYTSSTAACGIMEPCTHEAASLKPQDLYGATKAASEMFARTYSTTGAMQVHVIRPGYIFGEPVLTGGRSQPDRRFETICRSVLEGQPVQLTKHDGTQFLAAQDLAKVYERALGLELTFSVHYALSREWRSWEEIARMAMEEVGREVPIEAKDLGWGVSPHLFDVSSLRKELGLSLGNLEALKQHVAWQLKAIDQAS
jgi:UDP-glucose 4-epimerase